MHINITYKRLYRDTCVSMLDTPGILSRFLVIVSCLN